MGGRPSDWSPVAYSDPIPGDPDQVASLGKKLRKTADELQRQIRNLKAVAEVDSWDSEAGREYRKKAQGSLGKLEAAYKRYDAAADAMGQRVDDVGGSYQDKVHAKPTNYATDLNRAQEIADAARIEAQEADDRKKAAETKLDDLSESDSGTKRSTVEDDRDAASGDVDAAKDKVEEAKRIRDAAVRAACDSIENVIATDSLKDGFWESLVKDIGEIASWVATVAGVAAMLVGWIPIIGQALGGLLGAIALAASLVSTVCTLIEFCMGNADWKDLALAAVSFLMVGVGKAFAKVGGKFAKQGLSRLNRASNRVAGNRGLTRGDKHKLNRLSGESLNITSRDVAKGFKESMSDILTPKGLKGVGENAKPIFKADNWREMKNTATGPDGWMKWRNVTAADPGSTKDINDARKAADALSGEHSSINRVADKVDLVSVAGSAITGGGLALDGNVNPLVA